MMLGWLEIFAKVPVLHTNGAFVGRIDARGMLTSAARTTRMGEVARVWVLSCARLCYNNELWLMFATMVG